LLTRGEVVVKELPTKGLQAKGPWTTVVQTTGLWTKGVITLTKVVAAWLG